MLPLSAPRQHANNGRQINVALTAAYGPANHCELRLWAVYHKKKKNAGFEAT